MIELKNVFKKYYIGQPNELTILKDITININAQEFVSVVGKSGSGKSTLMNILGALDRPTTGRYIFNDQSLEEMNDNELSDIRNKKIGFVFQTFNLIPRMTALSNVELPLFYLGVSKKTRREKAIHFLEQVDMADRMTHMPNELSGGQKQRVAIARALINEPELILADEPTGALDTHTGNLVMDLFLKINKEQKKTIILITHNYELAERSDRIISISDGVITGDMPIGEAKVKVGDAHVI